MDETLQERVEEAGAELFPTMFADREYTFRGLRGAESRCRLRLFTARPIETVTAVVTELDDENTGTSVTNSAASLAGQICADYGITPSCFALVEHYREARIGGSTFDESYSRVNLSYAEEVGFKLLDWTHLTLDELAALTDTPAESWRRPYPEPWRSTRPETEQE